MTGKNFTARWARVALHFLVFSALAGVVLRYYNLAVIPGLNYKYLLHAHSHVALLGWMFFAFAAMLVHVFLPRHTAAFAKIFWLTLVAVIGMMLSFPLQGYGVVSISFSTLFLLASYWFVYVFYQKLRVNNDYSPPARWVRWALFLLVVSSFGPWALGPIVTLGEPHGTLYNLAIYYYLHFLYNGFFVPAAFGLMLKQLDNAGLAYNKRQARRFFQLTVYAVIPLYALSVLWIVPPVGVYLVSFLAGAMQLAAVYFAWPLMRLYRQQLGERFYRVVFTLALLAYGLKVLMQVISSVPVVAHYVYETRVFTAIAYLHMVMLGFLSLLALVYYLHNQVVKNHRLSRAGLGVFIAGLVTSVAILFSNGVVMALQGRYIPAYADGMFYTSLLMPLGILLFWFVQVNRKFSA